MADRYWVGGAGTWDDSNTANWSASSGGAGGASVPTSADSVIFDTSSGGGTVTISGTVVCLTFASVSGSTTWEADTGAKIQVHGNAATVVSMNNTSAFDDVLMELVYSGSTGTRTYTGPTSSNTGPRLAVTAGSDTVVIANRCRGVDFTGFTGTLGNNARTLYGHLTLGAGMTVTDGANATTIGSINYLGSPVTPSPCNITSNGATFNAPLALSAASTTVQMADALNTGARGITFTTSCSFDTQGFSLTAASITSSATGARTLTFGASTVTLSGSGTVFDATGASTTVSAASATFLLNGSSAKVFAGGGKSYGTLTQAGAGALTISGSNTFGTLNDSTQPATVTLTSGTTQTVTTLGLAGTSGNLITLNSSSPGTPATISKASGTVSLSYVSITDITATGGATFNAYTADGNVDGGGNAGWNFVAGANVDVSATSIAVTAYAPVIATGANIIAPLSTVAMAAFSPTLSTGANVQVPISTVAVSVFAPAVGSPVIINVPLTTLNVTTYAPTITALPLSALPRVTLTGRFILTAT